MNLHKIENNYVVELIKFSLEKENKIFSAEEAATSCNLNISDFNLIWKSIFVPTPNQENGIHPNEEYRWVLRPEAFFSYMSFLEYKDSTKSSKIALWTAIISIVIASMIGIVTMFV